MFSGGRISPATGWLHKPLDATVTTLLSRCTNMTHVCSNVLAGVTASLWADISESVEQAVCVEMRPAWCYTRNHSGIRAGRHSKTTTSLFTVSLPLHIVCLSVCLSVCVDYLASCYITWRCTVIPDVSVWSTDSTPRCCTCVLHASMCKAVIFRVTTCLENLEMSGNLTALKEMSGKKSCQGKVA